MTDVKPLFIDTNIVATMLAYGIPSVLTHNSADFKRFESIIKIEGIGP
ncbi:MAG: hypothetical protein MI864_28025 [Pseudomonadales bacterium]|nr:hypothetical protein [Oleiphilus messinensis]MCG8614378.1 hypothetical protein [Pseudomonadales bacterium]